MNLRTIVCSHDILWKVKAKFPNRPVEASAYAPAGGMCWFGRDGAVRIYSPSVLSVRGLDYQRGYPHTKILRYLKKPLI